MKHKMTKLNISALIVGAIVCLMLVVYVTANYLSFHLRFFDTEYININRHDGMVMTIVIKTIHREFTDPIYRTYIYVNHDWENPIIIQDSEQFVGSDTVKVKSLAGNQYQVIIDNSTRLLIWKKVGSRPAYGYSYE